MSIPRKHRDRADSNDLRGRIRFTNNLLPLSRLDSTVVENATMDRSDDVSATLDHIQHRARACSISQNIDLQDKLTEPGREPGVDVNEIELDIDHVCQITVTDYSASRYVIHGPFANEAFLAFMDEPRPEWSKIRWINVNGMAFDVMKKLSNTYSLHKLAVEDCIHFPTRTKIDHYAEHSYVCLALLLLIEEEGDSEMGQESGGLVAKFKNWFYPENRADPSITQIYRASDYQTTLREYHFPKSTYNRSVLQFGDTSSEVGIEQVSLFYTDSVVISMFEHSAEIIARPILKRIVASSMLLRTEDIDLLIHAIVDGIVDNCEAVVSSYQEHLASLERGVLDNPKREHTRELHLFISDLSLLRKTLAPVITIVNDFRNNLQNSVVAKAQLPLATPGPALQGADQASNGTTDYFGGGATTPNNRSGYWADVADHIYANADNIDSMRSLSDNLINMIFNTLSSKQNDIMRSLTITTVVFLPLSTTAGYFGMNFTEFGALNNSAFYFWEIAIPVTVFILLLAASPRLFQIIKGFRYPKPFARLPRGRGPITWRLRKRKKRQQQHKQHANMDAPESPRTKA